MKKMNEEQKSVYFKEVANVFTIIASEYSMVNMDYSEENQIWLCQGKAKIDFFAALQEACSMAQIPIKNLKYNPFYNLYAVKLSFD